MRVGADGTEGIETLGIKSAVAAGMDFGTGLGEGGGESFADGSIGLEEKEGMAFGAARADGGKLAKGLDEFGEGRWVFGHDNSK